MSAHEGCDGGFVPLLDEAPQQLPIRQPGLIMPEDGRAKVLNDLTDLGRHRVSFSSGGNAHHLPIKYRHESDWMRYFLDRAGIDGPSSVAQPGVAPIRTDDARLPIIK